MDILRTPRTSHRMRSRRVRRRIQHVLCWLPLCACACADTQNGTRDIDSLPQLSATVESHIGSVDDPDHGFSRLGGVDVDRDGNVYALEMLDHQIRVYDQSGQLLRRIGRKGGGPGEFDSPPGFEADSFAVTRINLAGDTVYHTTLGYRPVRYTPEQLDSAASRGPRSMIPIGGPAPPVDDAVVNALRAALNFPEFQLPVRYPWLGDDESVWLRREDEGDVARWILLEPDGRVRGELHLPPNARPLWHRGDEMWASVPDEMDVPWLVRYRISSTGS